MPDEDILQHWTHAHLPPHLGEISRPFCELAQKLIAELPPNHERQKALDRLMEAKDAAVRAGRSRPPKPHPEAVWDKIANRWFEPGQGPAIRGTPTA